MNDADPWDRAIIEQNQHWLLAYFVAGTGDRATAEDLVQEVFFQALENRERYDPTRPFGAWLRGIARNLLCHHYRDAQRRPLALDGPVLDQLDATASQAEERWLDPDHQESRLAALRSCLARLTRRARDMLLLRYGERCDSRVIGLRLGMVANTVDVALGRARRALADCVERQLDGSP